MIKARILSRRVTVLLTVFIAGLVLLVFDLHSIAFRKPIAPGVPVVSSCQPVLQGLGRLGGQYGFNFDIVPDEFKVAEGTQDEAPFAHGYVLRCRNNDCMMEISFDSDREFKDTDPLLVFSEHFEKRSIVDDTGTVVGHEYWGYLGKEKIWRRVHLRGRVDIKYDSASPAEAVNFDKVISSTCFLSARETCHGRIE